MDWVMLVSVLFACVVLFGLSELTRTLAPSYSLVIFATIPVMLGLLLLTGLVIFLTK